MRRSNYFVSLRTSHSAPTRVQLRKRAERPRFATVLARARSPPTHAPRMRRRQRQTTQRDGTFPSLSSSLESFVMQLEGLARELDSSIRVSRRVGRTTVEFILTRARRRDPPQAMSPCRPPYFRRTVRQGHSPRAINQREPKFDVSRRATKRGLETTVFNALATIAAVY